MKKILAGAIVIALIIVGFAGYFFYGLYSLNEGYKRIEVGDPESRVVKLMGRPGEVVLQGDKGFWSSYVKNSVREYHYGARIWPEIWIIGLDAKGNVVYRNHNIM